MSYILKAPFPWFGGKSRVARIVWERFGNVGNYVEPFFGSGATLLGRPHFDALANLETVNDLDGLLANFWRALQVDPRGVAQYADWPVNESDQYARHVWLVGNRPRITHALEANPEWYDLKAAGWWVWGIGCWMGGQWCGPRVPRTKPCANGFGQGVHRDLRNDLRTAGVSISEQPLEQYLELLASRLRRVRVLCGSWERVLTPSVTTGNGLTAVFLDPPYADTAQRADQLYACDSLTVAHEVRAWAIANGENSMLRIALCGYEGEHELPANWECVPWKAGIGFANRAKGERRNENYKRERIWFSPHCLHGGGLFD